MAHLKMQSAQLSSETMVQFFLSFAKLFDFYLYIQVNPLSICSLYILTVPFIC